VDDRRWTLRLPILIYGHLLATILLLFYLACRLTVRVRVVGREHLVPGTNYVFCHWHEAIPLFFQANVPRLLPALRGAPHAWMQHPLWFMKPIHVFLRTIGIRRLVLGSSGHEGRSAADMLVTLLRAGHSTVMFPDGPAGPARTLKKGVLHVAAQSGVPIVPLRLHASRTVRLPTWDRKMYAPPLSTITMIIGRPIAVEAAAPEASLDGVVAALG
jgi:lysophospholipid acyltransferase (LPLAT)-like uncharacterized protein